MFRPYWTVALPRSWSFERDVFGWVCAAPARDSRSYFEFVPTASPLGYVVPSRRGSGASAPSTGATWKRDLNRNRRENTRQRTLSRAGASGLGANVFVAFTHSFCAPTTFVAAGSSLLAPELQGATRGCALLSFAKERSAGGIKEREILRTILGLQVEPAAGCACHNDNLVAAMSGRSRLRWDRFGEWSL